VNISQQKLRSEKFDDDDDDDDNNNNYYYYLSLRANAVNLMMASE